MISCPNCDKQIADDSAHCGFCGHQLASAQTKTMFGMSAVTDLDVNEVQKATQAAKEAAQKEEGDSSKPKLPSPSLPSPTSEPSAAGPGSGSLPRPGGLSLPRPGQKSEPDKSDVPPDQAKTEAMAPVAGPPDGPLSGAPAQPDAPGGDAPGTDAPARPAAPANPTPMWGDQAPKGPSAPDAAAAGPNAWGDDVSGEDAWSDAGEPEEEASEGAWGAAPTTSSDDSWGDPSTAPTTPDQPAAEPAGQGWGDDGMPQQGPQTPLAKSGGGFPNLGEMDDNKKMLLYIGGAVFGLVMLCCVISTIIWLVGLI